MRNNARWLVGSPFFWTALLIPVLYIAAEFELLPTLSALEAVWITISFLGALVAYKRLQDALLDRQAVKRSGRNGTRIIIGQILLRYASLRAAFQTMHLGLGIVFAFAPSSPAQVVYDQLQVLSGVLALLVFNLESITMTINALYELRDRRALRRAHVGARSSDPSATAAAVADVHIPTGREN